MKSGMERILRPRSIAVIGGGSWCENVINQCRQFGFAGDIHPVHPTKKTLADVPCYHQIKDMPHSPDACFIGVNRHATVEVVRALDELNAGGAVCFASGFLEAAADDEQGRDLQNRLLGAAGDMTLIGPNCYGLINYLDGALLWPDEHGGKRVERGVAIITQSSNIAINLTMQRRGLPVAYVVTVGNQAQSSLSDIGIGLLADERVTALGIHIEGINDIGKFEDLAREARAVGKTIVALKVGKSRQARQATISHTASLAGSDAGARALLKRLGIAQVDSLSEMLEALKLVHALGGLKSAAIASMSCSGGEAALIADSAVGKAIEFPPLTASQKTELSKTLGPMVSLSNPLDYHTYIWGDYAGMTDVFTAMMTEHLALGLVILDIPRKDRCNRDAWTQVIACISNARDRSGVPMALLSSLPENLPEDIAELLFDKAVVPLCGFDDALGAIAAVGGIAGFDREKDDHPAPVLTASPPANSVIVDEAIAKRQLREHGIVSPRSRIAKSVEDVIAAARSIGFPVVLKGRGIAHKSEAGAVALGLTSLEAVRSHAQAMPTASFLIEEMITDVVAELLIGIVLDPAHGFVLTLAAGGELTELLNDNVSLLVPASRHDVIAALEELNFFPVLSGYRGKPAANIDAVVNTIMNMQTFVMQNHGHIVEVEINPLLCGTSDAVAADALIRAGETYVRSAD